MDITANRTLILPALFATLAIGLMACDKPTVNVGTTPVAVPGPAGPTGATGKAGATGAQGYDGATGATGSAGVQGDEGVKGDTGSSGQPGDGTTVIVTPAAPKG